MTNYSARIRVTLKPAVNDPQGLAIAGGLRQLGFSSIGSVRAGKYFDIHLEAPDQAAADRVVVDMCRKLLANPVIEDFTYEVVGTTN